MDNLPPLVATIAAVAVGLTPGIAILSARPIARLQDAPAARVDAKTEAPKIVIPKESLAAGGRHCGINSPFRQSHQLLAPLAPEAPRKPRAVIAGNF